MKFYTAAHAREALALDCELTRILESYKIAQTYCAGSAMGRSATTIPAATDASATPASGYARPPTVSQGSGRRVC